MSFEVTLQQAKEGNTQAILEIVEMYKPLIIRNAIVEGIFDEDLYQEIPDAFINVGITVLVTINKKIRKKLFFSCPQSLYLI